jgi:NH3-dependent NAD+ synthetase
MESKLGGEWQSEEELLEHIQYNFPDSMLANGYNSAIIGVAGGFDSGRVVYSVKKMVEVCMKELSVDADEAIEWLEYNTFGAFIGEYTPIYVDDYLS